MKAILVILSLIIAVVVGVCAWYFTPDSYTGKETFYTEQEYINFKEAISNPEVVIDKMEALSSSPPIVVDFSIRVPHDVSFNYGKKLEFMRIGNMIFGAVVVLIIILFISFTVEEGQNR